MRSKKWIVLALGAALVLVAGVACSEGSGEETQKQTSAVSSASQGIDRVEQALQETSQELSSLQGRVSDLEGKVGQFTEAAGLHTLNRTEGMPDPPAGKVALRLRFPTVQEALSGDGLLAYETTPEVNTVWAMESLDKGQALPVGPALKDSTLFLAPGESRTVAIAYKNPTNRDVGFMVLPHQESPGNLAQHVWPLCLCMSFVYDAPAEGSWYRVIKITASPDMPPGSKVDVAWLVLTDPSVFPTD